MLKVFSTFLLSMSLFASINNGDYHCVVAYADGELENATAAKVTLDEENNVTMFFSGEGVDAHYKKLSIKADEVEDTDDELIIIKNGPAAEKRVVSINKESLTVEVELSDHNSAYDIFGWFSEVFASAIMSCDIELDQE